MLKWGLRGSKLHGCVSMMTNACYFLYSAYDPADYENLPVTPEIKELFQYITRFVSLIQKSSTSGGSTLYEIYIGFCPPIDFHNIMLIDCLSYDYSICDIVFLLPIYMVKK